MLHDIRRLYEGYPSNLYPMLLDSGAQVSPAEDAELKSYGQSMRSVLADAQYYRLEAAAFDMLADIAWGGSLLGRQHLLDNILLPFPVMLLEMPTPDHGQTAVYLLIQYEDSVSVMRHQITSDGVSPAMTIYTRSGDKVTLNRSAHGRILARGRDAVAYADAESAAMTDCLQALMMCAMVVELSEKRELLELQNVPAFTRAERRQAKRVHRDLPDLNIVRIDLGHLGRAQQSARSPLNEEERQKRRAHWVAGHRMKVANQDRYTFRMPHIRGAGPVVPQLRILEGKTPSVRDDYTSER